MNHEWTILEYDKARDRIKRDTVGIKVQLFLNRAVNEFSCKGPNYGLFLLKAPAYQWLTLCTSIPIPSGLYCENFRENSFAPFVDI